MSDLAETLFTRVAPDASSLPSPGFTPTPSGFALPGDVRVAAGTDGSAMLVHRLTDAGVKRLRAVRVATDDTIGASCTLSPIDLPGTQDPYDPALAAAPNGEYAAAWGVHPDAVNPDQVVEFAYFEASAPAVTATIPATATAGEPVDMYVDADDRSDAEPFTYKWHLGGGGSRAHLLQRRARTVLVRVMDRAGNSVEATQVVTVTAASARPGFDAAPGAGPGPGTAPGADLDLTVPVIASLSVAPRTAVRGTPRQTTRRVRIAYRLNEAARVWAVFDRLAPGLRHGRACVAPKAALRRGRARACVRFVRVATLTRSGAAGANRIDIVRLRVGTRTLVPGVHRITLTATDTARNRAAHHHAHRGAGSPALRPLSRP
jgi:hypothetical protein